MNKLLLLLFAFFSLLSSLNAQRPGGGGGGNWNGGTADMKIGRFYGKIIDATTGKGAEYCSVQLLGMQFDTVQKTRKQAIIGGQLTGDNGEFSLENLPLMGEFLVLGTILMNQKSLLDSNEVTAKANLIYPKQIKI